MLSEFLRVPTVPLNQLHSRGGFSLVELMSVVAVIGVLAIISIPQYQKFTARARQVEAKTHLTRIYQGELSYFAEYNTFTGNLSIIGAGALGTNLRYDAGFRDGQACTGENPGTPPTANTNNNIRSMSAGATWYYETAGISDTANTSIVCTGSSYQVGAWGNPTNSPSTTLNNSDLFSINNEKTIYHLNIGL